MGEPRRRRHPHKALTVRAVQAARPEDRTRRIADGGGLYLLVSPSGAKSWVLRTVVQGKRCDLGLGSVRLVSLAEAREQAAWLRKIARAGGDPLAERHRARRHVPSFEMAARQVHASHAAGFRNEKHRKQWLASLSGAVATLGTKRVDAITSADILSVLSPQWLAKPETSRRVLQRLRVIFDWCRAQGYCSGDNPTLGLTKVLPKHRSIQKHHPALPYQGLPTFLQALRDSDASESVKLAFEFTILCAARTGEVLRATWDEVELGLQTWTIPGSRMKTGVEHRVPLSRRCLEILEQARVLSNGGAYVVSRQQGHKIALEHGLLDDVAANGAPRHHRPWVPLQFSGLGGGTDQLSPRGVRGSPGAHRA